MNMNQHSNVKTYDCITTTSGAMFRPRKVVSKDGKFPDYYAGCIAGKDGILDKDNNIYPGTISYDVKVVGRQAKKVYENVIMPYMDKLNERGVNPKNAGIFGCYRLGGVRGETFTYQRGEKKGQIGISNRGVLIRFDYLSIDGKEVDLSAYEESEADNTPASDSQAEPPAAEPVPAAPAYSMPNATAGLSGYGFSMTMPG